MTSKLLFDPVRRRLVKATPEERIRQATLRWMLDQGGFMLEHLVVERLAGDAPWMPLRRLDIAYLPSQQALGPPIAYLLVECKASLATPKAIQEAKRQLISYQWQLPSHAVALVSPEFVAYSWMNNPHSWIMGLPSHQELHEYPGGLS